MPLHTQAGDTTAVATSPLSLTSTPSPRETLHEATGHHPIPLNGRSPDKSRCRVGPPYAKVATATGRTTETAFRSARMRSIS